MTKRHPKRPPMTDKEILDLAKTFGFDDYIEDMSIEYWEEELLEFSRALLDRQLEQVIHWAKLNCWCWFEKSSSKKSFIVELQKAMRPTTTQEDN